MYLIKVEEGKVTDVICSDREDHEGYVVIPDDCQIGVGNDVRWYDKDWKPRPVQELVDEGIVVLADDEKVKDGVILKMTRYDKIKAGKESLRDLEYLDDEAESVKSGSAADLYALKKITRAQYKGYVAADVRAQRDGLLMQLDQVVMNPLRFNSLAPEKQAELAVYRQELLDVPQQTGFPLTVAWPDVPDMQS